jgi:predicted metalloprotease
MGPFYCPTDNKIYLDTSFYTELRNRFGAAGDFAQAYVIAHEVGHHIQQVTGVLDKAQRAQSGLSAKEGNAVQVLVELQADCYAGAGTRCSGKLHPRHLSPASAMAEARHGHG